MGFSRLLTVAALLITSEVRAQCILCDEVVEFDQTYAECYRVQYADLIARLDQSSTGREQVDLASCSGESIDSDRGGLLAMPSLTSSVGDQRKIKSIYVLDRVYAQCLKDLLDQQVQPIDPTVTFDLFESCLK